MSSAAASLTSAVSAAVPKKTEDFLGLMTLGTTKFAGSLAKSIMNRNVGGNSATNPSGRGNSNGVLGFAYNMNQQQNSDQQIAAQDPMTQMKDSAPSNLKTYFYNPRIK